MARGFRFGDQESTWSICSRAKAIQHKGFSTFIDVFSPCVTYNKDNTFQWFRPRVKKLEDNPEYDHTDWQMAMEVKSTLWGDEIPIGGLFFERTDVPATSA